MALYARNKWPDIGSPNLKLISYLKDQQEQGSKIILWTCRTGEIRRGCPFLLRS